jgi:hypothetical protein
LFIAENKVKHHDQQRDFYPDYNNIRTPSDLYNHERYQCPDEEEDGSQQAFSPLINMSLN